MLGPGDGSVGVVVVRQGLHIEHRWAATDLRSTIHGWCRGARSREVPVFSMVSYAANGYQRPVGMISSSNVMSNANRQSAEQVEPKNNEIESERVGWRSSDGD